jgi:DNA-binding beta-propeller fold protein YncE
VDMGTRRWVLPWAALGAVAAAGACEAGTALSVDPPRIDGSARSYREPPQLPVREGGVIARSLDGERLYVADEDRGVVRVLPAPGLGDAEVTDQHVVAVPGRPAALVVLADRVLVTVRDPGLLVAFEPDEASGLREVGRVALAADAWGLAVTADGTTALVSSAWSRQVAAVDVATLTLRWSVAVAREPRAIVIPPGSDRAYVTHLVGAALTRIDGIAGSEPEVTRVRFPAAPMRMPRADWSAAAQEDNEPKLLQEAWDDERAEAANLAYGATLSPDGRRLFVPRLALGATGKRAWSGQATVDVLVLPSAGGEEEPLARPADRIVPLWKTTDWPFVTLPADDSELTGPGPVQHLPFAQPRAVVYRSATATLLVASEGTGKLVELDALSVEPAARPIATYGSCGAPSGVVLDEEETTAYVFCRSTAELMAVSLDTKKWSAWPIASPHEERLSALAVKGRRLFYDAVDSSMSDGVACATCHPEGREDGHVWHEVLAQSISFFGAGEAGYTLAAFPTRGPALDEKGMAVRATRIGLARQTPLLAGRVEAEGPYGWRGESTSLAMRVERGFGLHRWMGEGRAHYTVSKEAEALAAFLREGLVAPPRPSALTPAQLTGKDIYESPTTGCTDCHAPEGGAQRNAVSLVETRRMTRWPYFSDDTSYYKAPPLVGIGGTEPYYHDGSALTLRQLIDSNKDHMGRTSHLGESDREALVDYLETL